MKYALAIDTEGLDPEVASQISRRIEATVSWLRAEGAPYEYTVGKEPKYSRLRGLNDIARLKEWAKGLNR